mmetsp:Transcript_31728/g.57650  ORF Transcript_31728/g.57650 Transcript_31728/m.57650 type:complete len:107 (-) Transcript_31728:1147-1467(-)
MVKKMENLKAHDLNYFKRITAVLLPLILLNYHSSSSSFSYSSTRSSFSPLTSLDSFFANSINRGLDREDNPPLRFVFGFRPSFWLDFLFGFGFTSGVTSCFSSSAA